MEDYFAGHPREGCSLSFQRSKRGCYSCRSRFHRHLPPHPPSGPLGGGVGSSPSSSFSRSSISGPSGRQHLQSGLAGPSQQFGPFRCRGRDRAVPCRRADCCFAAAAFRNTRSARPDRPGWFGGVRRRRRRHFRGTQGAQLGGPTYTQKIFALAFAAMTIGGLAWMLSALILTPILSKGDAKLRKVNPAVMAIVPTAALLGAFFTLAFTEVSSPQPTSSPCRLRGCDGRLPAVRPHAPPSVAARMGTGVAIIAALSAAFFVTAAA